MPVPCLEMTFFRKSIAALCCFLRITRQWGINPGIMAEYRPHLRLFVKVILLHILWIGSVAAQDSGPYPDFYEPPRITPQTSTARIRTRPLDEKLVERPTHFSYYRRHESRTGDYKVVTVTGINPRQAKIDAQTYHLGWDATDVWMGQSRVMYNVLLKKREPYIPGTLPIPRPIPLERRQ